MIQVFCGGCGRELVVPGALLFSPPNGEDCKKRHLCDSCFFAVLKVLLEINKANGIEPKPVPAGVYGRLLKEMPVPELIGLETQCTCVAGAVSECPTHGKTL